MLTYTVFPLSSTPTLTLSHSIKLLMAAWKRFPVRSATGHNCKRHSIRRGRHVS